MVPRLFYLSLLDGKICWPVHYSLGLYIIWDLCVNLVSIKLALMHLSLWCYRSSLILSVVLKRLIISSFVQKPLHDVLGFRKEMNGTTVDVALQWYVTFPSNINSAFMMNRSNLVAFAVKPCTEHFMVYPICKLDGKILSCM